VQRTPIRIVGSRVSVDDPAWDAHAGEPPPAWPITALLFPCVVLWTLPQTVAGLAYAAIKRVRGHAVRLYRFGPFLYVVVPSAPVASRGISLGVVVFADHPSILTHEFCHLYTAAWLGWLYLPVYGLEYLVLGHSRSPHERLTERFEARSRLAWRRVW
jgi:hypothetical protein